ncbi:MAG: glycosyltransferase family 39 protein, partial [Spirochaetia bacterium]|nr:glycosyltransferase family 39 protein [Spirochaetia bacterium]
MRKVLRVFLEILILISLLSAALALRLPWQSGLTASDDFFYAHLAADGARQTLHFEKYLSEAQGGHIWPYPFRFPVWIPTALTFYFCGISQQHATLWPLLASLLSILVVFLTARILFGTTAAFIAGCVLAALPSDILHSSLLLPEAPANLFLALSAGAFLVAWKKHAPEIQTAGSSLYFISGLSLALGIWTREYLIFLFP